jgi:F1F0 ATPase subunit 2
MILPYVAAGICLGLLYFGALWWNAHLLAKSAGMPKAVAVMAVRFAMLSSALVLAGRQGAQPLLAMAFGILLARVVVMRRVRQMT